MQTLMCTFTVLNLRLHKTSVSIFFEENSFNHVNLTALKHVRALIGVNGDITFTDKALFLFVIMMTKCGSTSTILFKIEDFTACQPVDN